MTLRNLNRRKVTIALVAIGIVLFTIGFLYEMVRQQDRSTRINVGGVEIKNIYEQKVQENKQGDFIFEKNSDYEIIYLPKFKEFLISITSSPFESGKQKAEAALLNELGISQEDACKLNIRVTTPPYVNEKESEVDYKLSFCQ